MNKKIIIQFFHYLWIVMGLAIVFFVLSQAIYTKRSLEYNLNFSESISRNIRGWYPEKRISSTPIVNNFSVLAEPIYMKIYSPIDFKQMSVKGAIYFEGAEDINLGLKQKDGSWDFKKIEDQDFFINLDLTKAQIRNNQLEIILSIPDIASSTELSLIDNWQIILSR